MGEQPAFFICGPVLFSFSTSPILLSMEIFGYSPTLIIFKHRKMFPGNLKLSAKCLFSSTKNYYQRKHAGVKFSYSKEMFSLIIFLLLKNSQDQEGFEFLRIITAVQGDGGFIFVDRCLLEYKLYFVFDFC